MDAFLNGSAVDDLGLHHAAPRHSAAHRAGMPSPTEARALARRGASCSAMRRFSEDLSEEASAEVRLQVGAYPVHTAVGPYLPLPQRASLLDKFERRAIKMKFCASRT